MDMPSNRLNPTEKQYPKFYDRPHDRAILSYAGEGRAALIFIAVIGAILLIAGLMAALPQ